jgi:hypothetical protein
MLLGGGEWGSAEKKVDSMKKRREIAGEREKMFTFVSQ